MIKPLYRVYYLRDAKTGELLYVGRSHKPGQRMAAFKKLTGCDVVFGPFQRFADFEEACKAEIRALHLHNPLHNRRLASGAGRTGKFGYSLSEKHRKRLSEVHAGKVVSAETRAKTSAALRGRSVSLEARVKISAANVGKKQSPETIAKRIASIKARRGISMAEGTS